MKIKISTKLEETWRFFFDMEFKDKVKIVRKKFYLSQEMMAKELGVAFATVNRWESGRCKPNYAAQRAFANFCKEHFIDVETLEDVPNNR